VRAVRYVAETASVRGISAFRTYECASVEKKTTHLASDGSRVPLEAWIKGTKQMNSVSSSCSLWNAKFARAWSWPLFSTWCRG